MSSSLIPKVGSDVTASSPSYIHFALVTVSTNRAFPYKLSIVFNHFYLSIKTTDMTIIAARIKLGIHDVVVNITNDRENRRDVMGHIRHFHIADCTARTECLEFGFKRQLCKSVYRLSNMNVVAVSNIILVCDSLDDAETFLQALGKLVCSAFQWGTIQREVNICFTWIAKFLPPAV